EILDLSDTSAIEQFATREGIEVIINCAAYTAVDRAEDEPKQADEVNHLAVARLSELTERLGIFLIHISTDYVFSGRSSIPYTEDMPTEPIGVYGQTKRRGEEAIQRLAPRHIILRTSWLYAPYGANFMKTMLRLGKERPEMRVVFDQVGTPTSALDLARCIVGIIERRQLDKTGLYHFSNEGVCSWYDFAEAIFRLSGYDTQLHPIRSSEYPTRAERPHYSVLDKARVREAFGITIPHWRTALEECLQLTASLPE
ncbi:MAG: dTDP-4-dehydrorhamnose reductase, partial [Porphyromonadaceae bacterium]|nr:dTDP-4-dehydrorhamnose reductase [Porphyromonadaceae bacterium]